MAKRNFFISTSIPYVNAAPHLGHAQEFIEADVIARFRRLQGDNVYFLSGTDDNAQKNVQAAEASGIPVAQYVNQHAKEFRDLEKRLNVSNDYFIETSVDPRHLSGAQKLWMSCKKEDIYKKSYRGLYCLGCEEFKTEGDLENGECPEHPGKKLEVIEEENYFFKLSNYGQQLKELIESGTLLIIPESRKNETLSFINSGLEDFSISRSVERTKGWGIPVPGDDTQTMYVWFDALSNYINALGYGEGAENFKKFWSESDERVHVIGKGINRFHTIYWPAMLLSAGVQLPSKVFIHGYITVDGKKMSKSIGNVLDPNVVIDEYGADAFRHYFTRHISPFEDGDFTMDKFKEVYNADLANGLGNLVSRVMKMAMDNLDNPASIPEFEDMTGYFSKLESYEINKAVEYIWLEIGSMDQHIQETQPFKVIKTDKLLGQKIISDLVVRLYSVARMLNPILPETSEKIKTLIKENKSPEKPLFLRKD